MTFTGNGSTELFPLSEEIEYSFSPLLFISYHQRYLVFQAPNYVLIK